MKNKHDEIKLHLGWPQQTLMKLFTLQENEVKFLLCSFLVSALTSEQACSPGVLDLWARLIVPGFAWALAKCWSLVPRKAPCRTWFLQCIAKETKLFSSIFPWGHHKQRQEVSYLKVQIYPSPLKIRSRALCPFPCSYRENWENSNLSDYCKKGELMFCWDTGKKHAAPIPVRPRASPCNVEKILGGVWWEALLGKMHFRAGILLNEGRRSFHPPAEQASERCRVWSCTFVIPALLQMLRQGNCHKFMVSLGNANT